MISVKKKKEMLLNDEISVFDLKVKEIKKLKESFADDLEEKNQELATLNQKIRDMKTRIDNYAN